MEQRKAVMDQRSMAMATHLAKAQCESVINQAENIKGDRYKEARLKSQFCKACFYSSRIGGQAMTTRPCMSCGSPELYSSTATDKLCLACAQEGNLCKRCGGDIDLRERRRKWPAPKHGGGDEADR